MGVLLRWNGVPRLARKKVGSSLVKSMINKYIQGNSVPAVVVLVLRACPFFASVCWYWCT